MKICIAQIQSFAGDITKNIATHKNKIELAAVSEADFIFFSELSLTGYEPTLAKRLAIAPDDSRLDIFQEMSDKHQIGIGVGVPIRAEEACLIGMIIFQPHQSRMVYAKQFLHEDEYPYFDFGKKYVFLEKDNHKIALAICYELSIPEHAETASHNHASVYIASVAKTTSGVERASIILAEIARKYKMLVLMSNCIGFCDNFESAGNSSAWNTKGELIGKLDSTNEGLLLIDTKQV
jgi:predicted amidohydrolase